MDDQETTIHREEDTHEGEWAARELDAAGGIVTLPPTYEKSPIPRFNPYTTRDYRDPRLIEPLNL